MGQKTGFSVHTLSLVKLMYDFTLRAAVFLIIPVKFSSHSLQKDDSVDSLYPAFLDDIPFESLLAKASSHSTFYPLVV